jgi:hypothetical protein
VKPAKKNTANCFLRRTANSSYSYWETAASLVNNGGIDEKMFLEANSEHLGIFAKLEPFIAEVREAFGDKKYLGHLEQLVMKVPNAQQILAGRRKLFAGWAKRE